MTTTNITTRTATATPTFLNAQEMNRAIARVSAFRDSADLAASMERGYVPTLRVDATDDAAHRRDILAVRATLRAHGLPMFPAELAEECAPRYAAPVAVAVEEVTAPTPTDIIRIRKLSPAAVWIITDDQQYLEEDEAADAFTSGATFVEGTRRVFEAILARLDEGVDDHIASAGTDADTPERYAFFETSVRLSWAIMLERMEAALEGRRPRRITRRDIARTVRAY